MEIKRTAHKLETNAKTNILPLQGAWHINVWRLVGETCLHSDIFSALCVSDNMLKQVKNLDRSLVNVLNVFFVLYVTQTLSKGITNVGN